MAASGDGDRRWGDLLLDLKEEVPLEIKSWLDLTDNVDKANLGKALLALANTGGGQIIIGYEEREGTWRPDSSRPHPIEHYGQDAVNGIVQRLADPQFHCEVHHVEHPETGDQFPIIDVPGGHKVPIRARRGGPDGRHVTKDEYYIRRPGPESAPPQTAREWDELIRRCVTSSREDLIDGFRRILLGIDADQRESVGPIEEIQEWTDESISLWREQVEDEYDGIQDSPYRDGFWTFSYSIDGDCSRPSLPDLNDTLRDVKGHETGWPPWIVNEQNTYPKDDTVESWIIRHSLEDAAHADFWRATPDGRLFLLRGYEEDSTDKVPRGEAIDIVLPIWRVGECLLHAVRLARELCDDDPIVAVEVRWEGLQGRRLVSFANPRRDVWRDYQVRQDSVAVQNTFSVQEIEDNLPEVVETLVQPLFQSFNFFDPTPEIYQEELERMRG